MPVLSWPTKVCSLPDLTSPGTLTLDSDPREVILAPSLWSCWSVPSSVGVGLSGVSGSRPGAMRGLDAEGSPKPNDGARESGDGAAGELLFLLVFVCGCGDTWSVWGALIPWILDVRFSGLGERFVVAAVNWGFGNDFTCKLKFCRLLVENSFMLWICTFDVTRERLSGADL